MKSSVVIPAYDRHLRLSVARGQIVRIQIDALVELLAGLLVIALGENRRVPD